MLSCFDAQLFQNKSKALRKRERGVSSHGSSSIKMSIRSLSSKVSIYSRSIRNASIQSLGALAIGDYMMPQLEDLDVEEFGALFFNPKHELLRRVRIFRGEVSENAADPRNIMRFGVLYNATYIVTVHNHVSGNPSPTKFDSTIAARLTQAAESVRMTLLDHIILADEQYYSFKDNKKL